MYKYINDFFNSYSLKIGGKNMKSKGFTLIELLAVIVILAVIALIVTPIVTGIIQSAKDSANARSVEGHIGNVNYQIIEHSFNSNNGDLNAFDGTKTESDLGLTMPAGDDITCTSYIINNGTVQSATDCTHKDWTKKYCYTTSTGANICE